MIHTAISKCDPQLQQDLFGCILLSGGSTMFPGLPERLQKELVKLAPEELKDKVAVRALSPTMAKHSAWVGGSLLGSMSGFDSMCISRSEYVALGPRVVHRKCFN